jgi:WXXGXW repeat (2 copies)
MHIVRSSALALMLGAASIVGFSATTQAQLAIDVRVNVAPPPLPFYEQPVIPAEGYLWIPGYWAWDEAAADYYWVPGTWVEPPQPELLWTPAYWGWVDGRYVFFPGYWAREVGFYGGIDYGYGYTGDGYFGGRWDNGVFFYNRSVTNFENVRITNVYNQTVVVRTTNNVSFNGGNGGITARPTPQQEAIARGRHVEATPVQRQQAEAASKDRSLFSKQNHGEPAVAATPRAGVFQGAGVSRGSRTPVAVKSGNETPASGAERTGPGASKEAPATKAGERPSPAAPPQANEREAPKTETPKTETPKAEEQRTPAREPARAEEPRTSPEEQEKARPQSRPEQEQPKVEQREPAGEPRGEEERRAPEPPRAQEPPPPRVQERPEQPRPVQPPRAAPQPQRPAPARPAEERPER